MGGLERPSFPSTLVAPESAGLSAPHRRVYYQLKDDVYFVPGAKRGAVCDTRTGNVYSVNETARKVILGETEDQEFSGKLQELGVMGNETPKPWEITKGQFQLDFVWFEIISDDCNERCAHCYADSMPPSYRRNLEMQQSQNGRRVTTLPVLARPEFAHLRNNDLNGNTDTFLSQPEVRKPKLTFEDWKRKIEEAYELGSRQCQFIGGEPFLYRGENRETVLDLARHAKEVGFELIEIFTNATLVNGKDIQVIKELDLHIAVSLYSDDEQVHESVTRTKGSLKKTMRTLEMLRSAQIPTRVESVLMKQNEATIDQTGKILKKMGFEHRSPDVLRPKGRGDDPNIQPSEESQVRYGLMLSPDFYASKETFARYSSGHSCLAGKLTITDSGDSLPCIFSRDQIVGNALSAHSLKEVVENQKLQDIWKTTKDDVLVCQDCEYRYVCFDCRPLSEGAAYGNGEYLTAPYPRCTYNPYEGVWGGGIWKVDSEGKPYYDETLKPIIEKVRAEGATGGQTKGHS